MGSSGSVARRIRIQKPSIQTPEEERMWREVEKYARLVPSEPDPNQGRIQEIKDEIKKGTYLIPEKVEETAAHIALRFMKRE